MKLRTFFSAFFLVLVWFAGANMALGFLLADAQRKTAQLHRQMDDLTSLSEDLVISSQWQTRFARGYIATRDPARLRFYNEIDDILKGKIARPETYSFEYWDAVGGGVVPEPAAQKEGATPLEERFLKLNITVEEFNQLKKAIELLGKVNATENLAMHAVNGEFDDGTGAFLKKGKPDPAMANKLLYGEKYSKENGELSYAIFQFNEGVKARFKRLLDEQARHEDELFTYNKVVSSGLFALVLISVVFLQTHFIARSARLMKAVHRISGGDLGAEIAVSGNDEIGELADALRSMAGNLKNAFEKLEEKVELTERTMVELDSERQRSEKLLHNILPAAIAERLRGGEEMIAEVFPEVTVFFSDIVGFTDLSARIGPHATVNMLNELFGKFDELAEKHSVEKIKTIGDSYMVVGGVPNRDPLHCQHIAEFAMEALDFVRGFSKTHPFNISMRMGVHTGTVAAGVLGKKKFSYDLWGDVVNVASRFESSSSPDRIHVSESVRVRLADDFTFEDAGTVELKGKGTVASFYLLGRKDESATVLAFAKKG
ncbi:adenylate/guanylate cyclase domain-containing protein [Methylocystis parvus]|uniref:adenylate/guanylate cyclase domain-containing protein n=1 Tax=Methylocystis parvus TaxID=134 RepID=UPI003C74BB77